MSVSLLVCRKYILYTVYQQLVRNRSIFFLYWWCIRYWRVNQTLVIFLEENCPNNYNREITQSQKFALKTRGFSIFAEQWECRYGIRWGESEERVSTETNVWGTGEWWWKGGQVRTRDGWTRVSQNNKENEGGVLQAEEGRRRKGRCWETKEEESWVEWDHEK